MAAHVYIIELARSTLMLTIIKIYKFPQSSLAELARNSVIQSGFETQVKCYWLGEEWYLPGAEGNNILKARILPCVMPETYAYWVLDGNLDECAQRSTSLSP